MITTNPFAEISATISPEVMQYYIIAMVVLVVGGTVIGAWFKPNYISIPVFAK